MSKHSENETISRLLKLKEPNLVLALAFTTAITSIKVRNEWELCALILIKFEAQKKRNVNVLHFGMAK